jgi:inorganic phosphate transporter, PiT family
LLVAVGVFVLASGVNDGGALLALGLRVPALRPVTALSALTLMLVLSPFVLGTSVATTLVHKLAPFPVADARAGALATIVASLVVVGVLARLRFPTSLTLGTVGALVGAGVGLGVAVSWRTAAVVLTAGIAAPLLGAAIAHHVAKGCGRLSRSPYGARRLVRVLHVFGFGAICVAYGANDGQRMLALFAIALAQPGPVRPGSWELTTIVVVFVVGAATGMYRFVGTLGSDLAPARPFDAAFAEIAAATTSFGGVMLGAPLSMTQSASAGLIASSAEQGWRRVRWDRVARLACAWVLTLPAAFVLGCLCGLASRSFV